MGWFLLILYLIVVGFVFGNIGMMDTENAFERYVFTLLIIIIGVFVFPIILVRAVYDTFNRK